MGLADPVRAVLVRGVLVRVVRVVRDVGLVEPVRVVWVACAVGLAELVRDAVLALSLRDVRGVGLAEPARDVWELRGVGPALPVFDVRTRSDAAEFDPARSDDDRELARSEAAELARFDL